MSDQLPEFQVRRRGHAMTNAQRQAAFRERNPDYYRQYRLRFKARLAANAEKAAAEQLALARAKVPLALPAPPERLCLPAPAEQEAFILPLARPERELVPVPATSTPREEPKHRRPGPEAGECYLAPNAI